MAEKNALPSGVILCTQDQARARYPNVKIDVGMLGNARRGDWIRLLVDWPDGSARSNEFLTAMVKEITQAQMASGLIKCRILSKPEHPEKHSLKYSDDITVSVSHVLEHSKATDDQVRTTAHLLDDLKPMAPLAGRNYWTRNGSEAQIWTTMQDERGVYLLGQCAGLRDVQWNQDGTHRGGMAELDIVKDPREQAPGTV